MSIEVIVILVLWFFVGFVSYGMALAFDQKEFVLISHRRRWLSTAFHFVSNVSLGPVALFATLIVYRPYHGLMFLPFSDEEWLEEATRQYPHWREVFVEEIGGAA